ncbi:UDP-glycosyltransferase 71A15-like protein [Drosera capensis]
MELVFIPIPMMGHLTPMVELARRLIDRDDRISISVLIMKSQMSQIDSYVQALQAEASAHEHSRIDIIQLPDPEGPPLDITNPSTYMYELVDAYTPTIKVVLENSLKSNPVRLAGIVLDMLCPSLIPVAEELNLPSYVFFSAGISVLNLLLHLHSQRECGALNTTEIICNPDTEIQIPGFKNPVPGKVVPRVLLDNSDGGRSLELGKAYRRSSGIIINAYMELQPTALEALTQDDKLPPIYPVGPIVDLNPRNEGGPQGNKERIMQWLDDQPPKSVVFLCFGSGGSFSEEQIMEIAQGLEQSGHRFLWALRRPEIDGMKQGLARDYEDFTHVLPKGFCHRTAQLGRVTGWAPQVAVLSHPAAGGFVSHVGWNSTMESLWCGVPIAAWPMYAEQHLNAFVLVKELELAIDIKMDFGQTESSGLVKADEIDKAIRELMNMENASRYKTKETSQISKKALLEGGSSYMELGRFIENVNSNNS